MTEQMSDSRLEAVLASIGEELAIDERATFPTVERIDRRRPRLRLIAAALVAVVAASTFMIPPARSAVADWLGIGSTRIEEVRDQPALESLPSINEESAVIPLDEAEATLARPLPDTSETGLGPPDGVVALPEGGDLLVWSESSTTLWIRAVDLSESINTKILGPNAKFRSVTGLGNDALLVTGDHVLQTPQRQIAAGTVLLWISEGIEYRLESTLAEEEMIEIARAIK